jgi:hypothetical protein
MMTVRAEKSTFLSLETSLDGFCRLSRLLQILRNSSDKVVHVSSDMELGRVGFGYEKEEIAYLNFVAGCAHLPCPRFGPSFSASTPSSFESDSQTVFVLQWLHTTATWAQVPRKLGFWAHNLLAYLKTTKWGPVMVLEQLPHVYIHLRIWGPE